MKKLDKHNVKFDPHSTSIIELNVHSLILSIYTKLIILNNKTLINLTVATQLPTDTIELNCADVQ